MSDNKAWQALIIRMGAKTERQRLSPRRCPKGIYFPFILLANMMSRTHLSLRTRSPVPYARLPGPGYESLALAFCLATMRCMNLGPSLSGIVIANAIPRVVLGVAALCLIRVKKRRD